MQLNPDISTNQKPLFTHRKEKMVDMIVKDFSPFNIYLWIHFIGYTETSALSKRFFIVTSASIVLSLINEGCSVVLLIHGLFKVYKRPSREAILPNVLIIGELYVRILLCLNRRKLHIAFEKLAKLYASQEQDMQPKLKTKLIATLSLIDLCFLFQLIIFHIFDTHSDSYLGSHKQCDFHFLGSYSKFICYAINYLLFMNMVSPFVAVFFCCECYMLKHILLNFKENLLRQPDLNQSFHDYKEITNGISWINDTFHNMLLTALSMNLIWTFYMSYLLLFTDKMSIQEILIQVFVLASSFAQFCAPCIFGSHVKTAMAKVHEEIYNLPFDCKQVCSLPLLLKASREPVGFKLLDSVTVDKSLIISATGNLLTYGILIATFKVSS